MNAILNLRNKWNQLFTLIFLSLTVWLFYLGVTQSSACRNISSSSFFLKVHDCSANSDGRILGTMMLSGGEEKWKGRCGHLCLIDLFGLTAFYWLLHQAALRLWSVLSCINYWWACHCSLFYVIHRIWTPQVVKIFLLIIVALSHLN